MTPSPRAAALSEDPPDGAVRHARGGSRPPGAREILSRGRFTSRARPRD